MGRGYGQSARTSASPRGGSEVWEFVPQQGLRHGPQGSPRASLLTVSLALDEASVGSWTVLPRAQVIGSYRGQPGRSAVRQTSRATERHLAGQAREWLTRDLARGEQPPRHRLSWLHQGRVVCATARETSALPVNALPEGGWVLTTIGDDAISYSWGRGRRAMTRRTERATLGPIGDDEPCPPGTEGRGDHAHEQLLAGLIEPRYRRDATALAQPFGENWSEARH